MQSFFQIPSNSFNLQHLAFAFALDAGEYVEQWNKQKKTVPDYSLSRTGVAMPPTASYCVTEQSDLAEKPNQNVTSKGFSSRSKCTVHSVGE